MEPDERATLEQVTAWVQDLRQWAYGNGAEGASERLRWIRAELHRTREDVDVLKSSIEDLKTLERRRLASEMALRNQLRGATALLSALITGLALILKVL